MAAEPAPQRIHFVLDGGVVDAEVIDPTRTVLQYLREDLRRTGTKEGCAEGDCGACTVVVGELDEQDRLTLKAVNSCIKFLPTLDGKMLFTVESLSSPGEPLHPVQQAMVDCHGSQCGFCTPGIVMSLFALYKSRRDPSRADIDDTLSGNLCRCTGYRPIIEAANRMYDYEVEGEPSWIRCSARGDDGGLPEDRVVALLRSIRPGRSFAFETGGRRYFAPRSLEEGCELASLHPAAILLAGGTDVGLWVTKQLRDLDTLIYLGGIAELGEVEVEDGHIEIGAAVTLTDAMAAICEHYPGLEELFARFASPPIRNAGTLGGNIANGSPIGDSMPALVAIGAVIVLTSSAGSRELPLEAFYMDYRKKDLAPGEILTRVRIPLPQAGRRVASYKVSKRFDQDISAVCGAYSLMLDDGQVSDIRVAYGGMAATPRRAFACERALLGREWTPATVASAVTALAADFEPITDMRSGSGYRSAIAGNLLHRFYLETSGERHVQGLYRYGR